MRKVLLLEHISLDGFVAGPAGEMNWIKVSDELWTFSEGLTGISDTALFGRVTYQMMEHYWPTAAGQPGATQHDRDHAAWVNAAPKLVFSKTLKSVSWKNSQIVSDKIPETIAELKKQPGKNLLMIGSASIAQNFMEHGLIDEFHLFLNPVLLGNGKPLFKDKFGGKGLKLVKSTPLKSGVIALCYESIEAGAK